MRIYLAGKIKANDWRHGMVTGLRGSGWPGRYDAEPADWPDFPVMPKAVLGKYDYTGPYFVGCDHSCYHGPNEHGVGAFTGGEFVYDYEDNPEKEGYNTFRPTYRYKKIHDLCLDAIDRSDVIFAWIEDYSCYGTLVELGYARGKDKKIIVAFGAAISDNTARCRHPIDLWFVRMIADKKESCCYDPGSELEAMVQSYVSQEPILYAGYESYQKYLSSPHWKEMRQSAIDRAGGRCMLCASDRGILHVHHNTYDRLGEEAESDLIVLCAKHHRQFHGKEGAK